MVTGAQKEALRQRGYTDDHIREMRPEDAHRIVQSPKKQRKRPKRRHGPIEDIDTST